MDVNQSRRVEVNRQKEGLSSHNVNQSLTVRARGKPVNLLTPHASWQVNQSRTAEVNLQYDYHEERGLTYHTAVVTISIYWNKSVAKQFAVSWLLAHRLGRHLF